MDYEAIKTYKEEISVLMRALNYYMYNCPYTTEEEFITANRLLERIETNCL